MRCFSCCVASLFHLETFNCNIFLLNFIAVIKVIILCITSPHQLSPNWHCSIWWNGNPNKQMGETRDESRERTHLWMWHLQFLPNCISNESRVFCVRWVSDKHDKPIYNYTYTSWAGKHVQNLRTTWLTGLIVKLVVVFFLLLAVVLSFGLVGVRLRFCFNWMANAIAASIACTLATKPRRWMGWKINK